MNEREVKPQVAQIHCWLRKRSRSHEFSHAHHWPLNDKGIRRDVEQFKNGDLELHLSISPKAGVIPLFGDRGVFLCSSF